MDQKSGRINRIKERAKQLESDIPAVFVALKDQETPLLAKALAGLTVGYALSPIDLIPDCIPVLGYLDDLILLPALVALTVYCIPEEIWIKSKAASAGLWKNGKPRNWRYAIPIAAIWLLLIFLIAKAIWF